MEIYKIEFTKNDLKKFPAKERNLFFLLGHIANETKILQKLLLMCMSSRATEPESWAGVTQSFMISKLLAGKLFEGWEKVRKELFSDKTFNKNLQAEMGSLGQKSLAELQKFFGASNQFSKVRNTLSFHYDVSKLEEAFDGLLETNELSVLLAKESGNSLYYVSEIVTVETLVRGIYDGEREVAAKKFFDDLDNCSRHFGNFIESCLAVLLVRNLKKDVEFQKVEISDPPDLDSCKVPFFFLVRK